MKTYGVILWTGNVENGGTNSDIWIRLFGLNGYGSKYVYLDDPNNDDFEAGAVDTFIWDEEDFNGDHGFSGIELLFQPAGNAPGWYWESWSAFEERNGERIYGCGGNTGYWVTEQRGYPEDIPARDTAYPWKFEHGRPLTPPEPRRDGVLPSCHSRAAFSLPPVLLHPANAIIHEQKKPRRKKKSRR